MVDQMQRGSNVVVRIVQQRSSELCPMAYMGANNRKNKFLSGLDSEPAEERN